MIEQHGRVERLDGESAWVICRPAACRVCDEGRGCGAGIFARLFASGAVRFCVSNRLGARPGERVIMGLDERGLLAAAFRLYGLPVAGLLLGSLLGVLVSGNGPGQDLAALTGGLAGLGAALWRARVTRAPVPEPVLLRRSVKAAD